MSNFIGERASKHLIKQYSFFSPLFLCAVLLVLNPLKNKFRHNMHLFAFLSFQSFNVRKKNQIYFFRFILFFFFFTAGINLFRDSFYCFVYMYVYSVLLFLCVLHMTEFQLNHYWAIRYLSSYNIATEPFHSTYLHIVCICACCIYFFYAKGQIEIHLFTYLFKFYFNRKNEFYWRIEYKAGSKCAIAINQYHRCNFLFRKSSSFVSLRCLCLRK